MIKVAIVIPKSIADWNGGLNYFRNLLTAVAEHDERTIEPVILSDAASNDKMFEGFPHDIRIITSSMLKRRSFRWFWRRLLLSAFGKDIGMEMLLKRIGASLISHSGQFGRNFLIPSIGWIPDFQHRHLPHLFTTDELANRDSEYSLVCNNCTAIVVSSNAAKKDLQHFSPSSEGKIYVLHFAIKPQRKRPSLDELESLYNLPEVYFHLPNQFWKHKNHIVVFEAIAIARRRGYDFNVVCTGATSDYRNPEYFNHLVERIGELDIADSVKILGSVSYEEMLGIMSYSAAVVNPSLFEGWSTTVEEAKTLRKPVLLSDIEVHREQAPDCGIYFDPEDPQSVADAFIQSISDRINLQTGERYTHTAQTAFEDFAREYEQIVMHVLRDR